MNKKCYINPRMMTEAKFLLKETLCEVSRIYTIDDPNTDPTKIYDDDDGEIEGGGTGVKGRGMEWGNLW